MKILVGVDGSDGGRDALEPARVLGSEADASVMVASVLFSGPLPIDLAGLDEEEAKEAEPLFEQAQREARRARGPTRAYGGGSPAAILTLLAEREEFDVIVVGSPHRGPVGRVLIGSVARRPPHGAPCAVLVAPKGYADRATTAPSARSPSPTTARRKRRRRCAAPKRCARTPTRCSGSSPSSRPGRDPGRVGYTPVPIPSIPRRCSTRRWQSVDPKPAPTGAARRPPGRGARREPARTGSTCSSLGSRGYGP